MNIARNKYRSGGHKVDHNQKLYLVCDIPPIPSLREIIRDNIRRDVLHGYTIPLPMLNFGRKTFIWKVLVNAIIMPMIHVIKNIVWIACCVGRNDVDHSNLLWTCMIAENCKRRLQTAFSQHENIFSDLN